MQLVNHPSFFFQAAGVEPSLDISSITGVEGKKSADDDLEASLNYSMSSMHEKGAPLNSTSLSTQHFEKGNVALGFSTVNEESSLGKNNMSVDRDNDELTLKDQDNEDELTPQDESDGDADGCKDDTTQGNVADECLSTGRTSATTTTHTPRVENEEGVSADNEAKILNHDNDDTPVSSGRGPGDNSQEDKMEVDDLSKL